VSFFAAINRSRHLVAVAILFFLKQALFAAPVFLDADICVYGGTSGGVAAAVAAARLGKNVALLCVSNHVGGMTSSGLGVTDVGSYPASIGGIAAEFYSRVGQAYGSTNPVYWFEPHVAEQTFLQMLNQAGVKVYTNLPLASVTLSNLAITRITMADGSVCRAKEFIDASYEGDLMAFSGVSYTSGREGTNAYGESLAGVFINSVAYPCDPYIIPGNPASGVLPLIQTNAVGTPGQGDQRMQTYNFRLCLTQVATNQIPITAPANYTEATYELLHRYITAYVVANGSVPLNRLIDVQTLIPNGKTDINAYADVSTDYIGYNYTYPTNTYSGRQSVYQQHKDYISGLLYYLATSTNVPANVRTNMQSYGYAKDEFRDNGGWPYTMYIREARRMVGDYVMLQQDAQGRRAATDSISLASYTLDCHPAARFAINGVSTWEGGIGTSVPQPYPVSYRSIVPATGQCPNLFCTFALSASHVGFASVRMEPVFMMTSHAAGVAAAFAVDDNVPVQQLNYQKLSAQLIADGQILAWVGGGGQTTGTNGIILTVTNAGGITKSGTWTTGANAGGWPLPAGTYWHDGNTGKGAKFVRFTPALSTNGYYDVFIWWVYDPNRANNTPVDIISATASNRVLINQQIKCTDWVKISSSNYFNTGTSGYVTVRNDNTTGYVVADAVRWLPLGAIASQPAVPTIEIVASAAAASEFGPVPGRLTVVSANGPAAAPLTVNYSVGGTAVAGVDYAALPGSVTLAAGAVATNMAVTPLGNYLNTNQVTVTISLAQSTNFNSTTLSNATVTIADRPINVWRRANFTPADLASQSVSGDLADPDNDGFSNLLEYAMGLQPKISETTNRPYARLEDGYFTLTYTQSKAATDASLTIEQSNDLVTWQTGDTYVQPVSQVDLGALRQITVRIAIPGNAASLGFLRFRVQRL
jgi:hypothetical protein